MPGLYCVFLYSVFFTFFNIFLSMEWGVVFAGGRKMKIFSTVFRDFGKNMVGKRYFQHYTVPVIIGKNNKKSGFEIIKKRYFDIWTSFKKSSFLILTLARFLELFEDFSWSNKVSKYYNKPTLTYFYTSFILMTSNETFEHLMYISSRREKCIVRRGWDRFFIACWWTFFKLPSNTFKI